MKNPLYIIGAGSVGGHVALNIEGYSTEFKVAGFFDDDSEKIGTKQFGFDVLGPIKDVLNIDQAYVIIGIAFPQVKKKIIQALSSHPGLEYPTLIHEKAWISKGVSIGKGCIIYPGTTINFGSAIHDFVVLNVNCSLGHHTSVGLYSSFAPGVKTGGHSIIRECVDMGIGSCTLQEIEIGTGSIVGGQSMITSNVRPDVTVAGVPAKELVPKNRPDVQP